MRNLITVLVGRKGSGKSTLALEIVEEFPRVIAIDTVEEYGPKNGFSVHQGFDSAMRALEAADGERDFRISLRLEEPAHAELVADVVFEFRHVLLVVEEASEYIKPSFLPPAFRRLALRGRHRGIDQLYIAQRPALLNRSVTSQADVLVTFQQNGKPDIDYLRDVFGDEAERARTLEPYAIMAAGPGMDRAPRAVRRRLRA